MGYYQVPLSVRSQRYSAFVVGSKHYEFTRMPFGLTNAPKTFQRIMQQLLKGLHNVKIYLDDIMIYTKGKNEHLKTLKIVLERLRNKNVSINFEKCQFLKTSITFLGHHISEQGITIDKARAEKLLEIRPRNRRGLQKIIGFCNWYRKFIPSLSALIFPLTEKLKTTAKFTWETSDQILLRKLYDNIKKAILLNHPNINESFILETDSSDTTISGILRQKSGVVGIFSQKLTAIEQRYAIIEKECLGNIRSLNYFTNIIFGCHVKIRTDSKNLTFLKSSENSRVQRWNILLSEIDYSLEHVTGENNILADFVFKNYLVGNTRIENPTELEKIVKLEK